VKENSKKSPFEFQMNYWNAAAVRRSAVPGQGLQEKKAHLGFNLPGPLVWLADWPLIGSMSLHPLIFLFCWFSALSSLFAW
jgi:hypothetical protein